MPGAPHPTIEEFAAEGYTHVECFCPRCRVIRMRPISWLPRILLATPVSATDAVTVCQQALTTDISKYTDNQFKSTLCTASIVYQRSAKTGDHAAMSACMKAIEKMLPDFARRFPGRKPHEVVGRCE